MKTRVTFLCAWLLALATSAQTGYYMEYNISGSNGTDMQMTGSVKIYVKGNNSRSEMAMNIPNMGTMKQTHLCLQASPSVVFMINDADKSYTETNTATPAGQPKSVTEVVSVIGQEKVGNFNCIHIKIKQEGKVNDMWVSKEVAGYATFSVKNDFMKTDELYKALKAKNIEGFPVKFVSTDEGITMTMTLTQAVAKPIDDSLFKIPADYTKKTNAMIAPGGPDPQKLQNMTEEERKKYIEQLKKQAGGQ